MEAYFLGLLAYRVSTESRLKFNKVGAYINSNKQQSRKTDSDYNDSFFCRLFSGCDVDFW